VDDQFIDVHEIINEGLGLLKSKNIINGFQVQIISCKLAYKHFPKRAFDSFYHCVGFSTNESTSAVENSKNKS